MCQYIDDENDDDRCLAYDIRIVFHMNLDKWNKCLIRAIQLQASYSVAILHPIQKQRVAETTEEILAKFVYIDDYLHRFDFLLAWYSINPIQNDLQRY
jgi:hypothetical protein